MTINHILQRISNRGLVDFDTTLEASYQIYQHQKLMHVIPRTATITSAALVIFALSDLIILPGHMAIDSVLMRIFVNVPLVLGCSFAAQCQLRRGYFELLFALAYLSVGWVTIYIIYLTEVGNFPRPREGFLLVLILGYFLLQLRLRLVCLLCAIISLSYLSMLHSLEKPLLDMGYAAFFVFSFNFTGLASAYLQDHSRRELFLNEQDLINRKEKDRQNIEQRKQLAATASHDLRQPLQGLNLLIENWLQISEGKENGTARKIKSGIGHVNRLLNSLFSLSHIENSSLQVRLENIDLYDFLMDIMREERARMEEKGIASELICDQSIQVYTDPILLGRIVRNILHNTIDHSDASQFKLYGKAEKDACTLAISDNGRGAEPSQLHELKQRFTKGSSPTKTGLGVGLFIIDELSHRLDASLKVTTQLNGGFSYQMVLPMLLERPLKPKMLLERFAHQRMSGRLLMVENDVMILDGLKSLCQQGGFTGEAYPDAAALLSRGRFPIYDCIVTDYHLDMHTGADVINHVRAQSGVIMPAIILTADTTVTAKSVAALITVGPTVAVYYKPMTRDALFAAIASVLDQENDKGRTSLKK